MVDLRKTTVNRAAMLGSCDREEDPTLEIVPVPAFRDNYVFVLHDRALGRAAVVDPGEAGGVLAWLSRHGARLEAVLLTHHHRDHVGGVAEIARAHPEAAIVGAAADARRLPPLTRAVAEGDVVPVLGRDARVIAVPGHTLGHVAYVVENPAGGADLFSGDTVFGATIGNLFEGTPDDMWASLVKLRALEPSTRLWCAHEYTLDNVRLAAGFDPRNARLAERLRRVEGQVARGEPTVPFVLEDEIATNPFFRWDDAELCARLGAAPGLPAFRKLCEVL